MSFTNKSVNEFGILLVIDYTVTFLAGGYIRQVTLTQMTNGTLGIIKLAGLDR